MSINLLREFCAENFTDVPAAIDAGADRIELCDNLAVGGTTPSSGVIAASSVYAHEHGVRVMTMIRPRGGDFVYSPAEVQIMRADIENACRQGTDGVVLGCLREGPNGYELDVPTLNALISFVRWVQEREDGSGVPRRYGRDERAVDITFHMAFDALPFASQLDAIDQLALMGVSRILTHGGPAGTPIEDNLPRLRELMAHAGDRITILPGAGITHENATEVARELRAREVHGTKIVRLGR